MALRTGLYTTRAISAWLFGGAMVLAATRAHAATPFEQATQLFDAGSWEPAALALEGVTRTGSPFEREVAEYDLAISLHRMGLPSAAYALFSSIADRPNHARFDETLVWLAKLAIELPEPADVIERIGKYDPDRVSRFAETQRETASQLRYLFGRYQYRSGLYEAALRSFADVGRASTSWVRGRFYCAAANVQLRRSAPAIACLREALSAIDAPGAPADDVALRDLAHLSIARVLYSDSFRLGSDRTATIDGTELHSAVDAWSRVDRASPLWLDALSEQAWAYFMERDDARALGNLHTLDAPYFAGAYYPEASILRSLIFVTNCQWEDATTTALAFQRKFLPIADGLGRVLTRVSSDASDARALALVVDVRADLAEGTDRAGIPAVVRPMMARIATDRAIGRQIEWVRFIDAERARLGEKSPALRASSLGGTIADVLQLAHDIAVRDVARLVRARLRRENDELDAHLRTSANVVVSIPTWMRDGGGIGIAGAPKAITVDHEHVKWPFDGEFWSDELGSYRQAVRSECAR